MSLVSNQVSGRVAPSCPARGQCRLRWRVVRHHTAAEGCLYFRGRSLRQLDCHDKADATTGAGEFRTGKVRGPTSFHHDEDPKTGLCEWPDR